MQTSKIKDNKSPGNRAFKRRIYTRWFKRPIDFILSVCAIIALSPLLVFVAVMVRIKLGKPVLFKQKRAGLGEDTFMLYKFRTMTDEKNSNGELLPDEERLTKFGKLLRSSSIDEFPEFFNIVRGEMSLVGPRPLLIEYLPLYSAHQKRRHEIRPGLSGLAQIKGRNAISWRGKLNYDVQYVENMSFLLDFKIMISTICKILKKEGINSSADITMEKFKGNES